MAVCVRETGREGERRREEGGVAIYERKREWDREIESECVCVC